jgi:hypothetical protein
MSDRPLYLLTDRARLVDLCSGSDATKQEVVILAEFVWNAQRRSGERTLRDDFAIAALNCLKSSGFHMLHTEFATGAYQMADAMLEARK